MTQKPLRDLGVPLPGTYHELPIKGFAAEDLKIGTGGTVSNSTGSDNHMSYFALKICSAQIGMFHFSCELRFTCTMFVF